MSGVWFNSFIDRVKDILLQPNGVWNEGRHNKLSHADWIKYISGCVGIFVASRLVRRVIFGFGFPGIGIWRQPFIPGVFSGVVEFGLLIAAYIVSAFLVEHFAPRFEGSIAPDSALRLVALSGTSATVAGVGWLVPYVGWMILVAGIGYSAYTFLLGIRKLSGVPERRQNAFFVTCLFFVIVVFMISSTFVHYFEPMPPIEILGMVVNR